MSIICAYVEENKCLTFYVFLFKKKQLNIDMFVQYEEHKSKIYPKLGMSMVILGGGIS